MSNTLWQFQIECSKAESMLASARALRSDVVWPAATCYVALALRLIELFARHPELQTVSLTCLLRPEVDETETSHVVKLSQHLKLTTLGAAVFTDIEEKAGFLANYAPVHLMGSGTFELSRAHPVLAGALQDLENGSTAATGYQLGLAIAASFKDIQVDVYMGQLLG